MKKILIIIALVIVAGVAFFALTNNKQEPMDTDQKDNVTATQIPDTTKTMKAKVDMPEGWKAVEGSVLDVQYMKNTASFILKTEYFATTDLTEVTSKALSMFKETFDNVVVVEDVNNTKVAGYDAKEFTLTAQLSTLSMKYKYVYTAVAGQVYAITFGDMASTFDNLSDDYQAILDSIKFVEE